MVFERYLNPQEFRSTITNDWDMLSHADLNYIVWAQLHFSLKWPHEGDLF